MEIINVTIALPTKAGSAMAYETGTKKRSIPIYWSSEYPKALEKMFRMKRLVNTCWKAVRRSDDKSYLAVDYIK